MAYDPTNGETPLAELPQYGGAGGSTQAQEYYAGVEFKKLFGRNPTQSELAMLSGAYAGDPNIANLSQGNQAVAQYFQGFSNNPANIYDQEQKKWAAAAPEHYDAINQIVQSVLGRTATQDELNHFGTLIASGQADPYQIQQYFQSTPEYQNVKDKSFRSGLDQELQQSDTNFFNTQKGNIAQQYALMGRATSPALDVALTQLASQLKSNRDSYLAQLSASQYGGNKESAMTDYNSTKAGVADRINQNTAGIYGNNQALQKRLQDITDYNTQANTWARLNQPQKPNWMDYLNAGVNAGQGIAQGSAALMKVI